MPVGEVAWVRASRYSLLTHTAHRQGGCPNLRRLMVTQFRIEILHRLAAPLRIVEISFQSLQRDTQHIPMVQL